jgi:predicted ATPase
MELVYLWVDKYNNIEKQGFNFSPRFECEYDGENLTICDKKVKDNNCKNKEYIDNFFAKNINVTAIVGENGIGKSNILEILFGNNIIDDCKFFYVVEVQVGNNKTRNIIAYKFDNNMSIYSKELELGKPYNLSDFDKQGKPIDKFSTLFYSTSSYTDNMSNQNSNIQNAENLAISEKETYLSYKLKSIQYAIFMIKNNANFEKLFELPKSITIGVKKYEKPKFWKELKPSDEFIDKIKIAIICEIYEKRQKEVDEKDIDYKQGLETVFNKIIEMPIIGSQVEKNINKFIEEAEKINKKNNTGVQINITNIETNFMNTYHNMVNSFFKLDIDLNILDFSWYPNLSTGQETYLFQFANFYNAMKKDNNIHNNCIILVDEGECTLHPNWQKKYINYLSNFLKDNFQKKNIHLILSSHSPFILSDIPKENVIFLEKYDEKNKKELENKYPKLKKDGLKNGNCINVTEHIELKTFGANIHTLLSDGFFMRDGLMGEFAKGKINEIKDFYEKVKKSKNPKKAHLKKYNDKKKDFENIQKIIGEPFLQTIIKNYLDELEEIFSNEAFKMKKKKEFLDQFSPEELQKYLDEKNAKA